MKTFNFIKTIVIVSTIISFTSCKKDSNDSDNVKGVLQPLAVGYTWTYVDSTFKSNGTFERKDTSMLKITGSVNDSIKAYLWTWYDYSTKTSEDVSTIVNNTEEGFLNYGLLYKDVRYLSNNKNGYLLFKYPVKTGDKWVAHGFSCDISEGKITTYSDSSSMTCSSTSKKIHTNAGDFNCYEYTSSTKGAYGMIESSQYFAENVGYIESIDKINGITIRKSSLLSYDLTSKQAVIQNPKAVTKSKYDFLGRIINK
jgi:hypothetical protein